MNLQFLKTLLSHWKLAWRDVIYVGLLTAVSLVVVFWAAFAIPREVVTKTVVLAHAKETVFPGGVHVEDYYAERTTRSGLLSKAYYTIFGDPEFESVSAINVFLEGTFVDGSFVPNGPYTKLSDVPQSERGAEEIVSRPTHNTFATSNGKVSWRFAGAGNHMAIFVDTPWEVWWWLGVFAVSWIVFFPLVHLTQKINGCGMSLVSSALASLKAAPSLALILLLSIGLAHLYFSFWSVIPTGFDFVLLALLVAVFVRVLLPLPYLAAIDGFPVWRRWLGAVSLAIQRTAPHGTPITLWAILLAFLFYGFMLLLNALTTGSFLGSIWIFSLLVAFVVPGLQFLILPFLQSSMLAQSMKRA